MTRPRRLRVAHLLDDFGMGGVTKGLRVFDSGPVAEIADHEVVAIGADTLIAPQLAADVIVLHMPPNWRRLLLLASLRARNPGARLVQVEHSYTRCLEAHRVPNRPRFRAMLSLAMRMVDQLVCVSGAQADWMAEAASLDRSRIRVIHPFCDNPGLAELPLSGLTNRGPLRIAAYGRYSVEKGFDLLIEAAKVGALDGMELTLAGAGPDEARLRAMAEGLPNVRVGGRIDDIAGFLAEADVVVVPSRWEAYGQVANEAREAGRPIIVAPTDGLVEQVGNAGMVIDFTRPWRLRRALDKMIPMQRLAMGAAGRAAVCEAGRERRQAWADLLLEVTAQPLAVRASRSNVPMAISAGQMR